MKNRTLGDIGEKALIRDYIIPLLNPKMHPAGPGDDCAILPPVGNSRICVSTDRVPAELIAFRKGVMNLFNLGYYLAILNISDIVACGGKPIALLLNLGLPSDLPLIKFQSLLNGAITASRRYRCPIVGGDISLSPQLNLVATSLGVLDSNRAFLRSLSKPGDLVYCTDNVGITPSAFAYLLTQGKPPPRLTVRDREILFRHFLNPQPAMLKAKRLLALDCRVAMDNTDGLAQSLSEIAEASGVRIVIHLAQLPIHSLSKRIAAHYDLPLYDLVLGPGADFQLTGTLPCRSFGKVELPKGIYIIGEVVEGSGVFVENPDGRRFRHTVRGWNYFT